MPSPSVLFRLSPVAGGHPAARRYLLARRNALPRDDAVIAVQGRWAHQQVLRMAAHVECFLWCPGGNGAPGNRRSASGGAVGHEDDPAAAVVTSLVDPLVEQVAETSVASYQVSERTLARLHPGARAPALLSVVRLPSWSLDSALAGRSGSVLVADGVEYAGNLGALVRTVDASGADGLVITNPVARLTHPAVFSASRGTVLTTPTIQVEEVEAAVAALRSAGFQIVVADPDGAVDYRRLPYGGGRTAIVVGSEGSGVCDHWRAAADERVAIPMRGRADSLNVVTAAAILLFAQQPSP